MKALIATDYGEPPENLEVTEVPDPAPAANQLLVRIEAAALNPFDLKLINGALREISPLTFPHLIGMDGSGTVAGLGAGTDGFSEGDAVVGFFGASPGTIAEYAVIDLGPALSRRPADLDAVHAAAVPESGMTALALLRAAELGAGSSVLVIGATGGIGMFIVQLASAKGADVIATGSEPDASYIRGLGATHVIDYTITDVIEETLALRPGGVDVVIDLIGMGEGIPTNARAVREGGKFVSPLGGPEELGRDVSTVYIGSFVPQSGDLARLLEQVAAGTLKVEVGRQYTLDQAPRAIAEFAAEHTRGKVAITL
jgi:NADPH:quinone reductase